MNLATKPKSFNVIQISSSNTSYFQPNRRPYENIAFHSAYPKVSEQRTSSSSFSSTGEASITDEDSPYSLPNDACEEVGSSEDSRDRSKSDPANSTLKAEGELVLVKIYAYIAVLEPCEYGTRKLRKKNSRCNSCN